MDTCKPVPTSCKPNTQLLASKGTFLADHTAYRRLVGALQYLTFTRPYLSYLVNVACQYMNSPNDVPYALVKRILQYVQGTIHCGHTYFASLD